MSCLHILLNCGCVMMILVFINVTSFSFFTESAKQFFIGGR